MTNKPLPILQNLNPSCNMLAQQLKSLPCNYFMVGTDLTLLDCNDHQAHDLGWDEPSKIINKPIEHLLLEHEYQTVKSNNQQVIELNKIMFFDELMTSENEETHLYLSIKLPLCTDNKIIGSFGISINLFDRNITGAANLLASTNLFKKISDSPAQLKKILSGTEIDGIYLSRSETFVLYHLVRGKTAKGIAKALNLSYRTVEVHIMNLKDKLNCKNKSELIEKAFDNEFYKIS